MKQQDIEKSKKRKKFWVKALSITMLVMMIASLVISLVISLLPYF